MDRICVECQRPDWSLRAGYSRKAVKGLGQVGESSLTIPTLVELCSADQAFPLITNRRALSHPPWPFHSLPWVVSRHNLQRAVGRLPRRQSTPKAGSSCQVLSPSPFLSLRDMEDGHIPLLRRPTAWEKGCACSNVLIYTDNSWIAFLGWEHPLPACPLVCSPAPWEQLVLCLPSHLKARPLNGLERELPQLQGLAYFLSPLELVQCYAPWDLRRSYHPPPHYIYSGGFLYVEQAPASKDVSASVSSSVKWESLAKYLIAKTLSPRL